MSNSDLSEATLLYTGEFDGSQIMETLDTTDAGFVKLQTTATQAFDGIDTKSTKASDSIGRFKKGTDDAHDAVNGLDNAQKGAANSADNLGFKEDHLALTFRQVNREASEGSRTVSGLFANISSGALSSGSALDIFRIAAGAAFHGPETLAIVGMSAAIGFLIEKIQKAKEEAKDVKWFGDPGEVESRYEVLVAQYAQLKHIQGELALDPYSMAYGPMLQSVTSQIANQSTEVKKLNDNLQQQQSIESQIAQIEADKVVLHSRAALQIAEDTNNPVKKLQDQQQEVLDEKNREQDQLLLLIKEHGLQQQVAQDQMDHVLGDKKIQDLDDKDRTEYGRYEAANKKLELQLTAENALYKAKGEELIDITKTQAIDLSNAKTKKSDALLKEQPDTEQSPDYIRQQKDIITAEQKFNSDMQDLNVELKDSAIENGADEFTKKLAQLDQWYNKSSSLYEKQAQDDAKRTGDTVTSEQRKNEKIELLDSIRSQKQQSIEAERAKKTEEISSQLTASLISDSENLLGVIAGQNKALFLASKAAAAADVIVNTQAAAAKIEAQLGILAAAGPEELLYAGMAVKLATIAATTIQGFKKGTRNAPPGVAWVGEDGPELVDFGGGEKVYTASESKAMSNSYSSNSSMGDVHVHIYGAGGDTEKIKSAVTSGVMEAKGQMESIRNARVFNDGTLVV